MKPLRLLLLLPGAAVAVAVAWAACAVHAAPKDAASPPAPAASASTFATTVAPFLLAHCIDCHTADNAKGDLSLDSLRGDVVKERLTWSLILDRVAAGEMPPRKYKNQPTAQELSAFTTWLRGQLNVSDDGAGLQPALPRDGNRVPHDQLFGPSAAVNVAAPFVAPPARAWRLRPDAYLGWVKDVYRGRLDGITQPFSTIAERGFKDYADLYAVDEATTEILVRNAELIVRAQTAHEVQTDKIVWKNDTVNEFRPLFDPPRPPATADLDKAFSKQFQLAIARQPTADELTELRSLYERSLKVADRDGAARTALAAVLLRPDVVYRMEHGSGVASDDQRAASMLAPREMALALSLALGDQRNQSLFTAAASGRLASRQDVAAHIRRVLDDPKAANPRLLEFFREYFEYGLAVDVFKDKPADIVHRPEALVADTDRLVLHILQQDRDVLVELLTTDRSFANYSEKQDKKTRLMVPVPRIVNNPTNDRGRGPVEAVYGLKEWPATQPVQLPRRQRMGILTQPSWLVAHSGNFDNDIVRRGRWVRERLLGGYVPQLPIGVAAQVPDEPEHPLRKRLQITRSADCWRCHRKMDELGLPFEQFDHLGRFRTAEQVLDVEATAKNVDKKGKPLGKVIREMPLDASGRIADSGDAALDGPVAGATEMISKLARSQRVRQVFVRHAFRFFLGRNETPADARTLQEADRAYVESGGSFKALVTALLSSESFLYRSSGAGSADASRSKS